MVDDKAGDKGRDAAIDVALGARRYRDAIKTLQSLEGAGFQARLAGGCVRDRLRGAEPVDFDIATTATPDEVMRHFRAIGWRTVPTGVSHGTVTLIMKSGPVEITTLRVDVATDGRHAQVNFGKSFEEDAARRDFTVNAMFEDAAGVIYDYHGGRDDLTRGVLRFVGEPAVRLREDYLRMLRFFRFQARFGFTGAPGTLAAISAAASGLARVSQERITSELLRTFAGVHVAPAVAGLYETGVMALVLPEVATLAPPPPAFWQALRATSEPRRALAGLAALCAQRDDLTADDLTRLGERLKLKTADTRTLAFLPVARARLGAGMVDVADALAFVDACEAHGGDGMLDDFFVPLFKAVNAEALLGTLATISRTEEQHGHRRRVKLPIDGALVARELGVQPGPALGEALAALRRSYRNGAWTSVDEGLQWLRANASKGGLPGA